MNNSDNYVEKKTGIFVPARLCSERLPNKQILPIGGRCMFDICCEKLDIISSHTTVNTYVLINDSELVDIAKKYKNVKIVMRDKCTCQAETPLSFIFKDILDVPDTHLMFLNPCLIFLGVNTIMQSIRTFNSHKQDYATSVKLLQNWIMDRRGRMINDINYKELTTKKIIPLYQTAHCFHIFNRQQFKEDGLMLKSGFMPIEIPEKETIDIDTEQDYEYAKWLYEQRQKWRHVNLD